MANRKSIRTRGKLQFSRYFQKLKEGDKVCVTREKSIEYSIPERLQGRTGVVIKKQGRTYLVKINDHKMEKNFLIKPIHLKKINNL